MKENKDREKTLKLESNKCLFGYTSQCLLHLHLAMFPH